MDYVKITINPPLTEERQMKTRAYWLKVISDPWGIIEVGEMQRMANEERASALKTKLEIEELEIINGIRPVPINHPLYPKTKNR